MNLAFVPTPDLEPKCRHKFHNRGIASGRGRGEEENLAIYWGEKKVKLL